MRQRKVKVAWAGSKDKISNGVEKDRCHQRVTSKNLTLKIGCNIGNGDM